MKYKTLLDVTRLPVKNIVVQFGRPERGSKRWVQFRRLH